MDKNTKSLNIYAYLAWTMALLATAASIFFIEIKGNPAAPLCWIERMLMLGLLLILTVGILKRDINLKYFSVPFLLLGIPSAAYQQLVHWKLINLPLVPCSAGFVCTTKFFEIFGFFTQATLCLTAFLFISFCLFKLNYEK